jgi:hypothetical protein
MASMKITNDLEFGWNHVFAPTPKNVELFLRGSRRILIIVGGSTFLAGANDWILFGCTIAQAVLEEVAGFIGEAIKPGDTIKKSIEFPAELEDKVEVTTEVIAGTKIKDEEAKDDETN